jgi:outer membrane receptor protein involved in Fe transport
MRFFLVLFITGLGLLDLQAQELTNLRSLTGQVVFKDGSPVVSALIYIPANAKSAYSDEQGYFNISGLAAQEYEVIIQPFGQKEIHLTTDLSEHSDNLYIALQQETNFALEDVVIKSKSKIRESKEKGYNIEVVNTQAYTVQNVVASELLDRSAGVKIRQSAGLGSHIDFNLNGLTGNSVRIFIDGIPLRNYGKAFSLNNIPPSMIERIEIYKGVLPGHLTEDALGGGINIILKKEKKNKLSVAYSYGSFNTHQADVNANLFDKKTGLNAQIGAFYAYTDNNYEVYGDNVYVINPQTGKVKYVKAERFHDSYESKGIQANLSLRDKSFADELSLGLLFSDLDNDIQTGATMDVVYGNRRSERDTRMFNLKYEKDNLILPNLSAKTFVSYSQTNRKVIDTIPYMYNWLGEIVRDQEGNPINWRNSGGEAGPATLANNNEKNFANRTGFGYAFSDTQGLNANFFYNQFTRDIDDPKLPEAENELLDTRFLSKTILSFSYEAKWLQEKLSSTLFFKNYHQKVKLTDYTKRQDKLTATAYDKKISFNGYGAAFSYALTDEILITSSVEKAIRMPGIFELLGNTSENILPTYNLRPENSTNVNLGASLGNFSFNKHQLKADINFFLRDISDMIVRGIASNITDQYGFENLGKVRSTGVDLEMNYNYDKRFTLTANLSNFNARYNLKYDEYGSEYIYYGDRLRNAPFLTGNLYANYEFKNLFKKNHGLNIHYNFGYTHRFFRNWESLASQGKAYIPTQAVHSAGINYRFPGNKVVLGFDAKNITNEHLFDNWALQKPGRAFYFKITYNAI